MYASAATPTPHNSTNTNTPGSDTNDASGDLPLSGRPSEDDILRVLRARGAQPSHTFRNLLRSQPRQIPHINGLSSSPYQGELSASIDANGRVNVLSDISGDARENVHGDEHGQEHDQEYLGELRGRQHESPTETDHDDDGSFAGVFSLHMRPLDADNDPPMPLRTHSAAASTASLISASSPSVQSSPSAPSRPVSQAPSRASSTPASSSSPPQFTPTVSYSARQLSLGALAGVQYGSGTVWDPWHSYFYQRVFGEEMTRAVALAIALVFTWLFIYTGTPAVALIATACVVVTETFMLGLIPVFGYSAGIVTAIPMLVFPGIAAVHMVRISAAYVSSSSRNPSDKVREALTKTAGPIVATCITIMCSCAFLVFSQTAIFRNFGSLILVTTAFHTFAALILCPSLLLLLGPSAQNGNLYVLILHSGICRRVLRQHKRWSNMIRRQRRVLREGRALEVARAKADEKARVALREALHALSNQSQWQGDSLALQLGDEQGNESMHAGVLPAATLRQLEENAADGARDLILVAPEAAKAWNAYQTLLQEPRKVCFWYRIPYCMWLVVCYGNCYCCRQCRRRLRETEHDVGGSREIKDGSEKLNMTNNDSAKSGAVSTGHHSQPGEYLDAPIPLDVGERDGDDNTQNVLEAYGSDSEDEASDDDSHAVMSELSFTEDDEEEGQGEGHEEREGEERKDAGIVGMGASAGVGGKVQGEEIELATL